MTARNPATATASPVRRGNPLLWAVWLVTTTIVVAAGIAVSHQLSVDRSGAESSGHVHSAFIRLRSDSALGPLLSWRLVTAWQLDAVAVVFLTLVAAWYLSAMVIARRRDPELNWPIGRTIAFGAGIAVCVVATNGSIAVYDMALFSSHMIGHLAFVMVTPALLMTGRPIELALASSGPRGRLRLRSILDSKVFLALTAPPVALASYATVIVASHLTGLMDTIMQNEWAGQLEHLAYLVIGCQFFMLVLGDAPIRWQLSSPARWVMLALSMAIDTFTGIVIMQSTRPIAMTAAPGLTVDALSDTHTGGAIMWFAGDGIMAAVMIALVIGWLRDPERQQRDNAGWLEQARRVTFAERTGFAGEDGDSAVDDLDFDSEDVRLRDYNRWLTSLNNEDAGNGPAGPRRR